MDPLLGTLAAVEMLKLDVKAEDASIACLIEMQFLFSVVKEPCNGPDQPRLYPQMTPLPKVSNLVRKVSLSRRVWRRWLFRAILLVLLVPLALQWAIAYLVGSDARLLPQQLQRAKNLLIVTAHPDDECLFFSPSILGVLDRNPHVRGGLLSISTGNNYGIGDTRIKELANSCMALGIEPKRCIVNDSPELQDNPKVWWNTDLIQTIVAKYVKKWDIDAILTFDSGGISGHINHRAVSAAINGYVASDPKAPNAYMLVSVPLWRKYTFLGDLPLTCLRFAWRILAAIFYPTTTVEAGYADKALLANTWQRYLKTRLAFRQHDSQYSWDRHLYMVLSRYVWFNDLVSIPRKDATAAGS